MGPDSSRLTAQDSSARDGWPCGDWPERQRATRVHHTATSRRRALSLPVPGTPLPYSSFLRSRRAEGHCLHTTVPRSGSATSARLYFRLESGRKQPIAARSGLSSPASGFRRVSSGRGNLLAPQGAEAGPVTQSLRPCIEGSTSSGLSRPRPSFVPSTGFSPWHNHITFSKQDCFLHP